MASKRRFVAAGRDLCCEKQFSLDGNITKLPLLYDFSLIYFVPTLMADINMWIRELWIIVTYII